MGWIAIIILLGIITLMYTALIPEDIDNPRDMKNKGDKL